MENVVSLRKVDHLGRVVLPIEFRRTFELDAFSDIEIFVDGDSVAIKKFFPSCTICRSTENTFTFHNQTVCRECAGALQEQFSHI